MPALVLVRANIDTSGPAAALAIPPAPLVVDGYVAARGRDLRRSVQEPQVTVRAACRGWRIARIVHEPVAAGGSDTRPMLCEALARVESREIDGIVTPSLEDVASSVTDAAALIERIHAACGTFFSIREQFDTTTHAGRLMLRLLLSLAVMHEASVAGSCSHDDAPIEE